MNIQNRKKPCKISCFNSLLGVMMRMIFGHDIDGQKHYDQSNDKDDDGHAHFGQNKDKDEDNGQQKVMRKVKT